MSALSALCWMIKHQNQGGIYFPDDIPDYHTIVKRAEKYISKTIYKTFTKDAIEDKLGIHLSDIQSQDFFANSKEKE